MQVSSIRHDQTSAYATKTAVKNLLQSSQSKDVFAPLCPSLCEDKKDKSTQKQAVALNLLDLIKGF